MIKITKKMRISFLICAAFLGAVVILTAAFLVYFQINPPGTPKESIDAASSSSSYAILGTGDLYTLLITFALVLLMVFFIIKS